MRSLVPVSYTHLVCRLYWWQHEEKTPSVSTAQIHRSIKIEALEDRPKSFKDYSIKLEELNCVKPEVYEFV